MIVSRLFTSKQEEMIMLDITKQKIRLCIIKYVFLLKKFVSLSFGFDEGLPTGKYRLLNV